MPNGDTIKDGVAFVDIRSQYADSAMYQAAKAEYDATGSTDGYEYKMHRFWHAGDILMANGAMYELYPELTPDSSEVNPSTDLTVDKSELELEVGETDTIKPSKDGCTFESADPSIADVDENGTVTGVAPGSTTVTVTDADGNTAEVTVTVTAANTTNTTTDSTTTSTDETTTSVSGTEKDVLLGDVNLDGKIDLTDAILLNKYCAAAVTLNDQALLNANCNGIGGVTVDDSISLLRFLVHLTTSLPND